MMISQQIDASIKQATYHRVEKEILNKIQPSPLRNLYETEELLSIIDYNSKTIVNFP
jgi:hypothetical protein